MSSTIVLAHKRTVGSGAVLAKELGAKCIVPKYPPRGGFKNVDLLINWGVSTPPTYASQLFDNNVALVNPFLNVRNAVNKVKTLNILQEQEIRSLRPIMDLGTAVSALQKSSPKTKLFARSLTHGSQGKGIDIYTQATLDHLIFHKSKYKMFTIGFPKTTEFRVHVVNGKVVDYSQKKKMSRDKLKENGIEEVNRDIRSHDKGWVFTKVKVLRFEEIDNLAIQAVEALGLTFGAVDILAKVKNGELLSSVVCEVNTSPSLSAPSTLQAYIDAFK